MTLKKTLVLYIASASAFGCASAPARPHSASARRQPTHVKILRAEITHELADLKLSEAAHPSITPSANSSANVANGEQTIGRLVSGSASPVTTSATAPQPAPTPELSRESLTKGEDEDVVASATDTEKAKLRETPLIFDIPVTYNDRVRQWIRYFQTEGRGSFRVWLERSSRYMPLIQYELSRAGLPLDLSYVAMVESGFANHASSHAGALGLWQFMSATGNRYGLRNDWWLDERRDFYKSTRAAIKYMSDLFKQFDSWYLVAASYNMGEGGIRRLIQRRHTNNFWELADMNALPSETRDYVPKIIAAMLISKAPALYGFRELNFQMPLSYDSTVVPGGTDLINLASYLGVSEKYLKDLNPELIKGFVPQGVRSHRIRVPKGALPTVSQYIRMEYGQTATN